MRPNSLVYALSFDDRPVLSCSRPYNFSLPGAPYQAIGSEDLVNGIEILNSSTS